MNSIKEISITLLLMLIAGLAGFAFYQYVVSPRSQVNIIDTGHNASEAALELEKLEPADKKSNLDLGRLVVKDLDANPVALEQWAGKTLVINFWATWCPPCRKEIPLFIEAQKAYADHNVQVLGLAMDDPKAVAKYMEQTDFNYPILISDMNETIRIGQAFEYNFIALPFTIFVSADGKTSQAHTGELNAAELKTLIEEFSSAPEM